MTETWANPAFIGGECVGCIRGSVGQAPNAYISQRTAIQSIGFSNFLRLILLVRRGRIAVRRRYSYLSRHWRIESKNTDNSSKLVERKSIGLWRH